MVNAINVFNQIQHQWNHLVRFAKNIIVEPRRGIATIHLMGVMIHKLPYFAQLCKACDVIVKAFL